MAMDNEKLFARYMKHTGYDRKAALEYLANVGLRRLAALDRNTSHSWAGEADTSRAAPRRKGRGKHKAAK